MKNSTKPFFNYLYLNHKETSDVRSDGESREDCRIRTPRNPEDRIFQKVQAQHVHRQTRNPEYRILQTDPPYCQIITSIHTGFQ